MNPRKSTLRVLAATSSRRHSSFLSCPSLAKNFPMKNENEAPRVGLIMGSRSDWETMQSAASTLEELGVSLRSARRVGASHAGIACSITRNRRRQRGLQIIIAGAGGAAHLPGMAAAMTSLPVLGVPVESKALKGMDSLLVHRANAGGRPGRNAGDWSRRRRQRRAFRGFDSGAARRKNPRRIGRVSRRANRASTRGRRFDDRRSRINSCAQTWRASTRASAMTKAHRFDVRGNSFDDSHGVRRCASFSRRRHCVGCDGAAGWLRRADGCRIPSRRSRFRRSRCRRCARQTPLKKRPPKTPQVSDIAPDFAL